MCLQNHSSKRYMRLQLARNKEFKFEIGHKIHIWWEIVSGHLNPISVNSHSAYLHCSLLSQGQIEFSQMVSGRQSLIKQSV